jgi:hypothetical protein
MAMLQVTRTSWKCHTCVISGLYCSVSEIIGTGRRAHCDSSITVLRRGVIASGVAPVEHVTVTARVTVGKVASDFCGA